MAKGVNKSQIAAELAATTGQSSKTVLAFLDGLAEIAYREAANGFIIPGICKLSVTKRKERRFRHPTTGQLFMISARDTLSIAALKKCRNLSVKEQETTLTPIAEATDSDRAATPTQMPCDTKQTSSPALPSIQTPPPEEEGNIVFSCEHCGNTVSAQAGTAGMAGECPFCSGEIVIPFSSPQFERNIEIPLPKNPMGCGIMGFVTFVCHACNQEIEAPVNMIGIQAACPSCGSSVYVPAEDEVAEVSTLADTAQDNAPKPDLRSMTIRIDLSDIT